MDVINKLLDDVKLPKMVKVKQNFYAPEVEDVAAEVHKVINEAGVLSRIEKGDKVAIAVGSRGVAKINVLAREVVNAVKSVGGEPFVFPAMGSHGGATAEGQKGVLEHMGVTEEFIGAPIRATMEVVKVGELDNGVPCYVDKYAYEADKIIVINRIKAHTAFRGKYESGLMKMMTIGLGKQKGADAAHQYGFGYMAKHVEEIANIVMKKAPVIFGLGSIENAYDHVAKIVALPVERIPEEEPALLQEAKGLMARIMFENIDVLVVDEMGKDISGDGMDPNIIGRYATPYASGGPDVKRIVVLDLTKVTHGNANGIGLADIITKKLFDQIDYVQGFANGLTSTVTDVVKVPMFMETNELAVKAGVKTCNTFDKENVKIVRIKNTLEVGEIWISEGLLEAAKNNPEIEILSEPFEMEY
ncbi:lactate racemase domain-containing protein [Bacillus sp. Marseille-P3661]|uniref:lactate racemase domain-containing protein n=1 Tax=Bacillus sp. Marseille-P3661 TaxID=1936234 RepID=UPI000C838388|nr:lactate racemase domain-containing protein [Bacillus sp. Marseille-P3661]